MRYLRHTPLILWLAFTLACGGALAVAYALGGRELPANQADTARLDRSSVLALRSAMVPVLHAQKTDRDRLASSARNVELIAQSSADNTTDLALKAHYQAVVEAAGALAADVEDVEQDLSVAVLVSRVEELANAVTSRSLGFEPVLPTSPDRGETTAPDVAPTPARAPVSPRPTTAPTSISPEPAQSYEPVAEVITDSDS